MSTHPPPIPRECIERTLAALPSPGGSTWNDAVRGLERRHPGVALLRRLESRRGGSSADLDRFALLALAVIGAFEAVTDLPPLDEGVVAEAAMSVERDVALSVSRRDAGAGFERAFRVELDLYDGISRLHGRLFRHAIESPAAARAFWFVQTLVRAGRSARLEVAAAVAAPERATT